MTWRSLTIVTHFLVELWQINICSLFYATYSRRRNRFTTGRSKEIVFFCLSNPFPSSSYPPVLRVEEEEGKEVVVVVVMLEEEEKVKIPF